jgi:hypothetical protein
MATATNRIENEKGPPPAESDWCDGLDLGAYVKERLIGRGSTGSVYLLNKDDGSLVRARADRAGPFARLLPRPRLTRRPLAARSRARGGRRW